MERKASSEIGDHAQRAAQAAKELAKSAGKVGLEIAKAGGRAGLEVASRGGKAGLKAGIAGGKMAAKYVKEHPKRTAIGMAVAVAVTQEGHEWKQERASFVEQSVEARVQSDEWLVDVRKVASVTVDESHGTLYALFEMILKNDPAFVDATADQRAHIIDAMIAAARELNPQDNLDDFDAIKGKPLLLPTEFAWRPREARVLKKPDGYATLQSYAEEDGFDMSVPHQAIYDRAKPSTVDMPLKGDGFVVDREGSEDSEPRLAQDVIEEIVDLGRTFGTLELGEDGTEWRFVVTDMLRDASTQGRRGSISQGSTHATGRSFDVSDGRFMTPEGEIITWSLFDEHGRPKGRGPNADVIDGVLRPAFETLALESGWMLYKEPGHWHVYVPEAVDLDLSEEWKRYAKPSSSAPRREKHSAERGEMSQKIGDRLLEDYGQSVRRRASFAELEPERDEVRLALRGGTFIHELKTHGPNYDRIVDQVLRAEAQDLGRLGYFEHTTIHRGDHPMSNIEDVWRWKTEYKLTEKRFGEYVEARVGTKNHGYDFESWYRDMRTLHENLQEHAEALAAHNGGLTSGEAQSLIGAITPEVMLATIHAELISELTGEAFIDVAPRLFDGYNIMQGPALHDFHFSSGPAQLICPTFKLMLAQYGAALRTVQKNEQDFGSVIIPKKEGAQYRTKDIADAMVLDQESATFWSYMSLVYHTETAFHTLMQNHAFRRSWEKAGESDRLRFMATFVPVANHVGRGGAINEANELLSKHEGKSLHDLAYAVQELRMKTSAVRSARVGLESMEEMIARAK